MIHIKNQNGKIIFTIREGEMSGGTPSYYGFWIKREDGEGMMTGGDTFIKFLEQYYKDNF